MASLISEERALQLAREVTELHARAKVDAHQSLIQLKQADQNETNAKIAARVTGQPAESSQSDR